ncbi:tRNA threonylcarbamoyladenosine biosynthesis protein TsaE [Sulfuritortus calidifontis]|uniref:tRNA threonylcarbamoyladenosine biosynthesis protein TsaE n=1 Tax=Sulfuritortus calidifontis TaxID=1914471 RepID=A0A4R3K106_9PROT|nr:tRNA (adenosine(37)-N6)-threonylcarbamoyltransferase complex ATPase subunit type 1 TsaE [Sulfuritortus calidifontis]TCS73886.1 tRNA threonylcarbamoyladenosine biosynthesis protein TsaE [Sulfuritortus calidifontis]
MPHAADDSLSLTLPDESATLNLGARLAAVLRPGMTVYLSGDLGAGKTTLVRGLLRSLGFRGRVKSPTYTLVELYEVSSLNLYHFDLYRFADPVEWAEAGFREYFNAGSICLVEWPEKAAGLLPEPDLALRLSWAGEGRQAELVAYTEAGRRCIASLKTA